MAKRYLVIRKPHLQRAHQCPPGVLDQMGEAVVGTASRQWWRIIWVSNDRCVMTS